MAEAHHRSDEDVEHLLLGVEITADEDLVHPEAGVVDEQVDGPRRVGEPRLDRRELGAIAQVGDEHLDRDPVPLLELGGEGREALAVPRDEHEVVAPRRGLPCELRADPRRTARDECRGHALILTAARRHRRVVVTRAPLQGTS